MPLPHPQALLQLLFTHVAERIETHLLAKRFDLFGALQLERDVRALGQRLGTLSTQATRSDRTGAKRATPCAGAGRSRRALAVGHSAVARDHRTL